ncbi:MAG: hypothetical protein KAY24_13645 [Candidatus Eisenbacteria sp.]|nr:hypothetical protein [Candidatus Eisenbacteria bacterium]
MFLHLAQPVVVGQDRRQEVLWYTRCASRWKPAAHLPGQSGYCSEGGVVGATDQIRRCSREIPDAYRRLRARNGPLGWWPGRTRLEIIVGAILTQNTAWTNVEKAIRAMKDTRLLALNNLKTATALELEEAIRPSGYFRQKAKKISAFLQFLDDAYAGRLDQMSRASTPRLRNQLLAIWGIGPETADSILLYAFKRPVFVVDAYTRRIATRHRWIGASPTYDDLQALFVHHLPADVDLYNDYHAQMVWTGKHHCRVQPRCEGCPLRALRARGR